MVYHGLQEVHHECSIAKLREMNQKFYLQVTRGTEEVYFPLNPPLNDHVPCFQVVQTVPSGSSVQKAEEILKSAKIKQYSEILQGKYLAVLIGKHDNHYIFLIPNPELSPFDCIVKVAKSNPNKSQKVKTFLERCRTRIVDYKATFFRCESNVDLELTTGNAAYLFHSNTRKKFEPIASTFNQKGSITFQQVRRNKAPIKSKAVFRLSNEKIKSSNSQRSIFHSSKFLNLYDYQSRKDEKFSNLATNLEEEHTSLINGAFEIFIPPESLVYQWNKLKESLGKANIDYDSRKLILGYIGGKIFCDPSFRMTEIKEISREKCDFITQPALDVDHVRIL
jgi:hypothetical protein